MSSPSSPLHTFRAHHMATYFEIKIVHSDATYARQAAQAAFQLCAELEKNLSRYIETSEISQIATLAPGEMLRLSPETCSCLLLARDMHQLTLGTFDPTLGPEIDAARQKTTPPPNIPKGRFVLDETQSTVQVFDGPVRLDLGALGKGFALDQMAGLLADWDIRNALLISGGSSILALGSPDSSSNGWEIHLGPRQSVRLQNAAIGSSGTAVKGAHILDPRTGIAPKSSPFRSWALAPTAAVADALSTAWMLLQPEQIRTILDGHSAYSAYLQISPEGQIHDLKVMGDFHLILPAYQEENRLPTYLVDLIARLGSAPFKTTLQIVDDGSPASSLQQLLARLPPNGTTGFVHLASPLLLSPHIGKGHAIRKGWMEAPPAKWLAFVDADGAIPATEVVRIFQLIHENQETENRPDCFCATRCLPEQKVHRPWLRRWGSWAFRQFTKAFLPHPASDPQCGFKIVSSKAWTDVASSCHSNRFCFDLELLHHLFRKKKVIRDVPLTWQEKPGGHFRPFRDGLGMMLEVMRLSRKSSSLRRRTGG